MKRNMLKLFYVVLLCSCVMGMSKVNTESKNNISFKNISDSKTLSDKIHDNLNKEIYVLFFYHRYIETYEIAEHIIKSVQNNKKNILLLQVPVDDIGFEIAKEYKLEIMPTLIVFRQAKELVRFDSFTEIKKWLETQTTNDMKNKK